MNKPAPTTKTILLAEDDEDDFLLFQEVLNEYKEPTRMIWVKDGEELIRVLRQDKPELPDMVFLDINMPRKNGFECLAEIRQNENLKTLPVIIFSTSNDKALVSRMHDAGASLFLCKPSDFRKLKESIEKAISLDWKTQQPYPPEKGFVT